MSTAGNDALRVPHCHQVPMGAGELADGRGDQGITDCLHELEALLTAHGDQGCCWVLMWARKLTDACKDQGHCQVLA